MGKGKVNSTRGTAVRKRSGLNSGHERLGKTMERRIIRKAVKSFVLLSVAICLEARIITFNFPFAGYVSRKIER